MRSLNLLLASILFLNSDYLYASYTFREEAPPAQSLPIKSSPLQTDAEEFAQYWDSFIKESNSQFTHTSVNASTTLSMIEPEEITDPHQAGITSFVKYVNKVMKKDGIGVDKAFKLNADEEIHLNDQSGSFKPRLMKYYGIHFEDILDKKNPNAFACYFIAYFMAHIFQPSEYDEEAKGTIVQYLNAASKKYYLRATQFLLKHKEWRKKGVTKQELMIRQHIIWDPKKAALEYIEQHPENGSTSSKDVNALKSALFYLPGEYDNYHNTYQTLAEELYHALKAYKKQEGYKRIEVPIILSNIVSSFSTLTVGITNIVNGPLPLYVIGGAQVLAGCGNMVSLIPTVPRIYNWFNKQPAPHKLLPSSYKDDEIIIQSKVIALYCILSNEKEFKNNNFLSLTRKDYIKRICKLILEQYKDYDQALSTVIRMSVEDDFKLDIEEGQQP